MYILFESSHGCIYNATLSEIDCMGAVMTEREAMSWRNDNLDYRTYKYIPVKK